MSKLYDFLEWKREYHPEPTYPIHLNATMERITPDWMHIAFLHYCVNGYLETIAELEKRVQELEALQPE